MSKFSKQVWLQKNRFFRKYSHEKFFFRCCKCFVCMWQIFGSLLQKKKEKIKNAVEKNPHLDWIFTTWHFPKNLSVQEAYQVFAQTSYGDFFDCVDFSFQHFAEFASAKRILTILRSNEKMRFAGDVLKKKIDSIKKTPHMARKRRIIWLHQMKWFVTLSRMPEKVKTLSKF